MTESFSRTLIETLTAIVLSAKKNDQSQEEPIYINGKRVGLTPLSQNLGACSIIEIGKSKTRIELTLKAKATNQYVFEIPSKNDNSDESNKVNDPRIVYKFLMTHTCRVGMTLVSAWF